MILIIGSTYDDVIYFDSKLRNKTEEKSFGTVKVFSGDAFSQRVVVAYGASTSYMMSAATSYLADKYSVILVINVGKCFSYSDSLKVGDVVISESIHICDVDQRAIEPRVKVGQIPGMPEYFNVSNYLINLTLTTAEKLSLIDVKGVTFFSSDVIYNNAEQIKDITSGQYVLGVSKNVVFDSESGAIAVATHLVDVPSLCIKVVASPFTEKVGTSNLVDVMHAYARVGRLIVALIGEISRNDTIAA